MNDIKGKHIPFISYRVLKELCLIIFRLDITIFKKNDNSDYFSLVIR